MCFLFLGGTADASILQDYAFPFRWKAGLLDLTPPVSTDRARYRFQVVAPHGERTSVWSSLKTSVGPASGSTSWNEARNGGWSICSPAPGTLGGGDTVSTHGATFEADGAIGVSRLVGFDRLGER